MIGFEFPHDSPALGKRTLNQTDDHKTAATTPQQTSLSTTIAVRADDKPPADIKLIVPDSKQASSKNISRLEAWWKVSKGAFFMGAAFTFTLSQVLQPIIAAYINDELNTIEAATLAAALIQVLVIGFASPIYGMGNLLSNWSSQLTTEETDDEKKKDIKQQISRMSINGPRLSILLSVLPTIASVFSEDILTSWIKQDKAVSRLAQTFSRPFSLGIPPNIIRLGLEMLAYAVGGDAQYSNITLLAWASLVIGTAAAIFLGIYCKLGLAGIAIGYDIEAWLTCLFFSLYLAKNETFKEFNLFGANFFDFLKRLFKWDKDDTLQIKEILIQGLPAALTSVFELLAGFIMVAFAGHIGQLSVQYFASLLTTLAVMPNFSSAQVIGMLMSNALGANEYKNVLRLFKYGLLAAITLGIPLFLGTGIYPKWLTVLIPRGLLSNAIAAKATPYTRLTALNVGLDAVRLASISSLKSLANIVPSCPSKFLLYGPTVLAIIVLFVGVLAAYFLKDTMGIMGIGLGSTIGLGVGALLVSLMASYYMRPEKLVEMSTTPLPASSATPPALAPPVVSKEVVDGALNRGFFNAGLKYLKDCCPSWCSVSTKTAFAVNSASGDLSEPLLSASGKSRTGSVSLQRALLI